MNFCYYLNTAESKKLKIIHLHKVTALWNIDKNLVLAQSLKHISAWKLMQKMEDWMVSDDAVAKDGDFEDYCDVRLS